ATRPQCEWRCGVQPRGGAGWRTRHLHAGAARAGRRGQRLAVFLSLLPEPGPATDIAGGLCAGESAYRGALEDQVDRERNAEFSMADWLVRITEQEQG